MAKDVLADSALSVVHLSEGWIERVPSYLSVISPMQFDRAAQVIRFPRFALFEMRLTFRRDKVQKFSSFDK